MSMSQGPYIIGEAEAVNVLKIPDVWNLPDFNTVRRLYKKLTGRRGCSRCRRRRARPRNMAPAVGAALLRAIGTGQEQVLYNSIAKHYSIDRPIRIQIGPCNHTLRG